MRQSLVAGLACLVFGSLVAGACNSSNGTSSGGSSGTAGTPGGEPGSGSSSSGVVGPPCQTTAQKCDVGQACAQNDDCANHNCLTGKCTAPTCTDDITNSDESGIDCGGATCAKCDGATCAANADCKSARCSPTTSKCAAAADKVCGVGVTPAKCATGDQCQQALDCTSDYCGLVAPALCAACPSNSHADLVRNCNETDVDCGTAAGVGCGTGLKCLTAADCEGTQCNMNVCNAPTTSDGKKSPSLGETDVDCGGATAPKCLKTKVCAVNGDCYSGVCTGGHCESTQTGRKDGEETDLDCGGRVTDPDTNATVARCVDDKACKVDSDCSGFCNPTTKKCTAGRSCGTVAAADTAGITTCGLTDPTVQESCCRSLPLPTTTTVRLDKYEVTAGRFRKFIETVGPDVRGWVANQIAMSTPAGLKLAVDLPTSQLRLMLPAGRGTGLKYDLYTQLGMTVMDTFWPSRQQGCYTDPDAYGHNTYYWTDVERAAYFGFPIGARRFGKEVYDAKSMNCGTYMMYAAFCAWDGGRMPKQSEYDQVWGTQQYPWGPNFDETTVPRLTPLRPTPMSAPDWTQTVNYANKSFYAVPAALGGGVREFFPGPGFANGLDDATGIAEPGRFPLDKTSIASANGERWYDIAANLMELTSLPDSGTGTDTFCDFSSGDRSGGDTLSPSSCCLTYDIKFNPTAGQPVCPANTCVTHLANGFCDPGFCAAGARLCKKSASDAADGSVGILRSTTMPRTNWIGGSFEGHQSFAPYDAAATKFSKVSYNLAVQTQYGKTGFRCAR